MNFSIPPMTSYKTGTNQYEVKHKFLKKNSWISIAIVILVAGILVAICVLTGEYDKKLKLLGDSLLVRKVWAMQKTVYKLPELAPLPERETNIALIKKVWGKDSKLGLAIARAESGYQTKVVNYNTNGTVDQGVFQVNSVHEMPEMDDAVANISYAYTMFLKQGTTPWDSSKIHWSTYE